MSSQTLTHWPGRRATGSKPAAVPRVSLQPHRGHLATRLRPMPPGGQFRSGETLFGDKKGRKIMENHSFQCREWIKVQLSCHNGIWIVHYHWQLLHGEGCIQESVCPSFLQLDLHFFCWLIPCCLDNNANMLVFLVKVEMDVKIVKIVQTDAILMVPPCSTPGASRGFAGENAGRFFGTGIYFTDVAAKVQISFERRFWQCMLTLHGRSFSELMLCKGRSHILVSAWPAWPSSNESPGRYLCGCCCWWHPLPDPGRGLPGAPEDGPAAHAPPGRKWLWRGAGRRRAAWGRHGPQGVRCLSGRTGAAKVGMATMMMMTMKMMMTMMMMKMMLVVVAAEMMFLTFVMFMMIPIVMRVILMTLALFLLLMMMGEGQHIVFLIS